MEALRAWWKPALGVLLVCLGARGKNTGTTAVLGRGSQGLRGVVKFTGGAS